MKVACVQIKAYGLDQASMGMRRALAMIDEAAELGADLIVLPECTYPAYFVGGLERFSSVEGPSWGEAMALFGSKARERRCHLVVGMAVPGTDRAHLRNAAMLFGPDGEVLGSTTKSFLWHFDRHWFERGQEYPVFDTAIGRIGLMICADGRMPEIARILALQGAQVIVDPTALVTGSSERSSLSNPQIEYMLPIRALENGVSVVVANKVGLEADSVLYCGRSCVIDPRGELNVVGSPDREEVITCDIMLSGTPGVPLARRPSAYGILTSPLDDQPITHILSMAVVPARTILRVAAMQLHDAYSEEAYWNRVEGLLDTLCRQDVDLVLLPGDAPPEIDRGAGKARASVFRLRKMSERFAIGLGAVLSECDGARKYRTCFLWDSGRLVGKYRKVHPDEGYTPGNDLGVFKTRYGRVGIMLDEEAALPEVPRCLMLKGADVLLWPARASHLPMRTLARARADENRCYVVFASSVGQGAAIADPKGGSIAAGLPDVEQVIASQIAWVNSRSKEMAPGTDVVYGRLPETYSALTEEPPALGVAGVAPFGEE